MNYDDHCINLGRLWGDLQYLEVTLRIFLTEANPSKSYITNLDTFGTLVVAYNGQLSRTERSLYSVDTTVIHIRNALAHGLVSGTGFPLTLLHKGQEAKMTLSWFDDQQTLVRKQEERISACGRERWPKSK